jgi:hypothetical protein
MNKRTLQILTIGFLMTGLIGCNGVSQNDYDTLKAENEKLKLEIEELKFGPEKLLSQAKVYLDNKDFNKAKSELQTLLDKHPTSQQAIEGKQLITIADNGINVQKLANEKEKIEKEKSEKERLANATKKLRTKYDDIKGITWYYDKGTPQYTNYNSFHLYMGKEKTGQPWLRFRIQYTADDWLFIQSYVIKTDNDSYTISTSYGEVETDHGSGDIWEWYDVPMDNSLYNIVQDVIKSKSVKVRHNGKQYYKDRTITQKEKQGLQNMLDAYEALGGTTNF